MAMKSQEPENRDIQAYIGGPGSATMSGHFLLQFAPHRELRISRLSVELEKIKEVTLIVVRVEIVDRLLQQETGRWYSKY